MSNITSCFMLHVGRGFKYVWTCIILLLDMLLLGRFHYLRLLNFNKKEEFYI